MTHIDETVEPFENLSIGSASHRDRWNRRIRAASLAVPFLTVLAFALPIAALFWLIHAFGVNALRADQWDDVRLIGRSFKGTLGFSDLWSQHNENRILSQNLVTLLLAHTTRLNAIVEDYLIGILLVTATGVLIVTHHRRSPRTLWTAYWPVALVMLSLVQFGTVLFGFQVGWAMIMLALAVVLWLLDRDRLSWLVVSIAILVAVVASYSSLQGLLIWPVGLSLLYQRRRSSATAVTWTVSGLITTALYFSGWSSVQGGTSISAIFQHPTSSVKFFLFALGDVVGVPATSSAVASDFVILFGFIEVLFGVWLLFRYGCRRDESSASPIGVALIWFGLLFAVLITGGRGTLGIEGASASRYTTFDLLLLAGSYLTILGNTDRLSPNSLRGWLSPVLGTLLGGLLAIQVVSGFSHGVSSAREYKDLEVSSADVMVNINKAPDGLVESQLGSGYQSANFIRSMVRLAMTERLSLFATAEAEGYRKEGLSLHEVPPSTRMVKPTSGSSVSGNVFLVAAASDEYGVTRVEFKLTGPRLPSRLIGKAAQFPYGWLGGWDSRTVPNGVYTLQSVAFDSSGQQSLSSRVTVTVDNPNTS